MRHQTPQIHNPILHQSNRPRPRIGVAILEPEVNLLRTESHERNRHVRFADADDENFAAEFDAVDRVRNRGFDAGAFERDGRLDATGGFDNLGCCIGGGERGVNFVGSGSRAYLLRVLQAAGVDVGDDDWASAGSLAAEKGDEANRASAADEDTVAEGDAGALHACEGDGQGFQQGAVFKGHVVDFVAPAGGMVDVTAKESVDGRGGEEFHLLAAIVATCEAGFAVVADKTGFDGDAVTGGQVGDGRVGCEDFAGGFMAEDMILFYDHGANGTVTPEVDVGSERRG